MEVTTPIHVPPHTPTQFERFDMVNGRISEYDFAKFILSHSVVNEQRRKKYLGRMKKAYGKDLSDDSDVEVGVVYIYLSIS